MKEETRRVAERLGLKYTVLEKGTDPEAAEQAYFAAYAAGQREGFYPALLLLDEYALEWLEEMERDGYDREAVRTGCGDQGKELLEERFQEYTEDFGGEELADFMGQETEGEILDHFIGYCSFTDRALEEDTLPASGWLERVSVTGGHDCHL